MKRFFFVRNPKMQTNNLSSAICSNENLLLKDKTRYKQIGVVISLYLATPCHNLSGFLPPPTPSREIHFLHGPWCMNSNTSARMNLLHLSALLVVITGCESVVREYTLFSDLHGLGTSPAAVFIKVARWAGRNPDGLSCGRSITSQYHRWSNKVPNTFFYTSNLRKTSASKVA